MRKIYEVQKTLQEMHKEVKGLFFDRRSHERESHIRKTNIVITRCEVRDFARVRCEGKIIHMLAFRLIRQKRIEAVVCPHVCVVEQMVNGKTERVYCARTTKYKSDLEGQNFPEKFFEVADRCES